MNCIHWRELDRNDQRLACRFGDARADGQSLALMKMIIHLVPVIPEISGAPPM